MSRIHSHGRNNVTPRGGDAMIRSTRHLILISTVALLVVSCAKSTTNGSTATMAAPETPPPCGTSSVTRS